MDWIQIGKRIKYLRGSFTLAEFAKMLGTSPGFLSEIERAKKRPSVELISRLAEISDRSYSWILTGDEEDTTKPSRRAALEKEPPLVISKKENPNLYRLVTLLKESKPKEAARVVRMALAYFEKEKKGRS